MSEVLQQIITKSIFSFKTAVNSNSLRFSKKLFSIVLTSVLLGIWIYSTLHSNAKSLSEVLAASFIIFLLVVIKSSVSNQE